MCHALSRFTATQRDKCHALSRLSRTANLHSSEQAGDGLDELAARGYAGPVTNYIHNIGKAFVGTVAVNDDGLLVVDGGRVFVRCEQVSAIEVSGFVSINRG